MKSENIKNRKVSAPPLEKVIMPHKGSVLIRHFTRDRRNTRPYWHYHPELELVLVKGGNGKRHIGSHLSYFEGGELVLIGSNLPHQGFTERIDGKESETVIQMLPEFLGPGFLDVPEMSPIATLFERAKKGLAFGRRDQEIIGSKILQLLSLSQFEQIVGLLEILYDLAMSEDYAILNANGFLMTSRPQDNDRLNKVLNYIKEHFQEPISLEEVCELTSMTEPSFCRYFKKITNKTFKQFLNEYRLVHASKLLSEQEISIGEVCYKSGFGNYSHFVDKFKSFAGKSPSDYRKSVLKNIQ